MQLGCDDLPSDIGVNKIDQLIRTLQTMNAIFDSSLHKDDAMMVATCLSMQENGVGVGPGRDNLAARVVPIAYTDAEEKWLNLQLSKFQDSYQSVRCPEKIICALIHHWTTGEELSLDFTPSALGFFCARFQNVVTQTPEFQRISDRTKAQIWEHNYIFAVALNVVKMETSETAVEQLKYLCAEFGEGKQFLQQCG